MQAISGVIAISFYRNASHAPGTASFPKRDCVMLNVLLNVLKLISSLFGLRKFNVRITVCASEVQLPKLTLYLINLSSQIIQILR